MSDPDSSGMDSSGDETWILDVIALNAPKKKGRGEKLSEKPPKAVNPPPSRIEETVDIPAVFLTQGAKNSRLLRQSEEIKRQLEEELAKTKAQMERLGHLKLKIVTELNDNGSAFTYCKNDPIVENYVQRHLARDHTLYSQRHFYFFNDVSVNLVVEDYLEYVFGNISEFNPHNYPALLQSLERHHINMESLVNYALGEQNVRVLDAAESFIRHVTELQTDPAQTEPAQTEPAALFAENMEKIGARSVSVVPLKLVHFSSNLELLVLRLSVIFHYHLSSNIDTDRYFNMLRYFVMSLSDFSLNKYNRKQMLQRFVRPVLSKIIKLRQLSFSESKISDIRDVMVIEINQVLQNLRTNIYGEPELKWKQKDYELHYNFLRNLQAACQEDEELTGVITSLQMSFLQDSISGTLVPTIPELKLVTARIGKTDIENANVSLQANKIFKNIYKAHIVLHFLMGFLYSQSMVELQVKKSEFSNFHQELQITIDGLQQAIGRLLFMRHDDVECKTELSTALSETYHILDRLNTVLDKNSVFIRKDIFYEK